MNLNISQIYPNPDYFSATIHTDFTPSCVKQLSYVFLFIGILGEASETKLRRLRAFDRFKDY